MVHDLFGDSTPLEHATAGTPGGSGAVYAAVSFWTLGGKMSGTSVLWGPYAEITKHSGRGLDHSMFNQDGAFDIVGMTAAMHRHLEEQGRVLLVLNFFLPTRPDTI